MTEDDAPRCERCRSEDVRIKKDPSGRYQDWCETCQHFSPTPGERRATTSNPQTTIASRRSKGRKARDPAMDDALLAAIASLGGIATSQDLRPIADAVDSTTEHHDLSWALINMRDQDRLLYSPFGNAGRDGDELARRGWLKRNRPSQPSTSNQVWALSPTTREQLRVEALSKTWADLDPAAATRFTAALLRNYRHDVMEQCDYRASRIIEALEDGDGPAVVRDLMDRYHSVPSDGFTNIVESGHPELTFEAHVLKQEWDGLFTSLERVWCHQRLVAVGHEVDLRL